MTALDPNSIVTVQVSTILAPFPSGFQQTGAIVSFGGTNQPTDSVHLLTQYADLELIMSEPMSIASVAWATGVATFTTTNPLPGSVGTLGNVIKAQLSGFTPDGYNGTFNCTVTGADEFTVPITADPGTATVMGEILLYGAVELNAQVATFFRQGNAMTVNVLELGFGSQFTDQIAKLDNWLANNTFSFYGYLLPEEWGYAANIPLVLQTFEQFLNPEAMTYFWLTLTDPATVGMIPLDCKSVIQLLEAPTVPIDRANSIPGTFAEFTLAGMFYQAMQYRATAVTRIAPMCFKYVYGVTPYPLQNNGPLLISMKNNFVNYIQTGAEGGINFTNVYQGVTADGFDYFNWWWTIDWVQLNINQSLSNAVINGANNPLAPLYYNQYGITYLETILAGVMTSGVQFGMVNGPVIQTGYDSATLSQQIQLGTFAASCNVNAVPFLAYSQQNPADYGVGEYDGLSTLFIPSRGFVHILVVVTATNIVTL
jgi:hypothetical protein